MTDELKSWVADPLLQVVFWTSEKVISNNDLNVKERSQDPKYLQDKTQSKDPRIQWLHNPLKPSVEWNNSTVISPMALLMITWNYVRKLKMKYQ